MARILAIEPDHDRAVALEQRLRESLDATIVIATSAEAAIAAMKDDPPDLVLISFLLCADEDHRLGTHLRANPALRHLTVLAIPPVTCGNQREKPGLFSRIWKRPNLWQAYDFDAVAARIREALADAKAMTTPHSPGALVAPPVDVRVTEPELQAFGSVGSKQRRARRYVSSDLPWISAVKFSWGQEIRLINISRSGMLIESGMRLTPGSLTQFQVSGKHKDFFITARVVRSRVSHVQPLGVHYMTAAQFENDFDTLADSDEEASAFQPEQQLAVLVARLRQHAIGGATPDELRAIFEAGVRRLVAVRNVSLREAPRVENDGRDSIYFTIPTVDDRPAILQVTFEPNYRPAAEEFATLRAASLAAAHVLELAGSPTRHA
jgi:hypothetical protein